MPRDLVICWQAPASVHSVYTKHLIGPVSHFPNDRVERPTACARQPLRLSEIRFALPQSLLSALARRQVEHEGNTLILTFEARSTNQYGHAAAVLADVVPFKRLQAPGALDLCGELLTIAAKPLSSRQISPAQAARDEILTLVSRHTEKRIIGLENGAIEFPNED